MNIDRLMEEEAQKEKRANDAWKFVRYENLGYLIACSSPSNIPKQLSKLTKDSPEHNGFLAGLEKHQKEVERNRILQRVLENDLSWEKWRSEMER